MNKRLLYLSLFLIVLGLSKCGVTVLTHSGGGWEALTPLLIGFSCVLAGVGVLVTNKLLIFFKKQKEEFVPEKRHRKQNSDIELRLIGFTFLFAIPHLLLLFLFGSNDIFEMLKGEVFNYFCFILLIYFIYRRQSWARIILTLILFFCFIVLTLGAPEILTSDRDFIYLAAFVCYLVMHAYGIFLLLFDKVIVEHFNDV